MVNKGLKHHLTEQKAEVLALPAFPVLAVWLLRSIPTILSYEGGL